MHDPLALVRAGLAGVALGALFCGGLWWTVRKGVVSPHPARWFFGSLLLRMGMVLAGFYLVGGGQWPRLLACLLGFISARFLVLWLTRAPRENPNSRAKEARHAP